AKKSCRLRHPIEKAQNGNGQALSRVGMTAALAPHPLGVGASAFWPARRVSPDRGRRRREPGSSKRAKETGSEVAAARKWSRNQLKKLDSRTGKAPPHPALRATPGSRPGGRLLSRLRDSLRRQAAVDHDLRAGDERRFVAGQKED